jgi:hypothetical protein
MLYTMDLMLLNLPVPVLSQSQTQQFAAAGSFMSP